MGKTDLQMACARRYAACRGGPHPPEVIGAALTRARFCEPLAPKVAGGSEGPFLLGLMSLLDVILLRLGRKCRTVFRSRRKSKPHGLANPARLAAPFELALAHETGKLAALFTNWPSQCISTKPRFPRPIGGPSPGRKTPAKPDGAALPGTFYTSFSSQVTQGTCAKSPVVSNIRLFPMATLPCWPFRAQAVGALD